MGFLAKSCAARRLNLWLGVEPKHALEGVFMVHKSLLLSLFFILSVGAANFICDVDQQNYVYMQAWCASSEADRLKKEYALATQDPAFQTFLTNFVSNNVVAALLANRPSFDYAGKSIQEPFSEPKEGEEDAFKEERAQQKQAKEENEKTYNVWFSAFEGVLKEFSGHIIKNPHHEFPTALVVRFDAFPQYVVKMRARNGYRLGFYDAEGRLSCAVPGTKISEYPFPAQLVARVLYAEKIKAFLTANGITNIQVPNKYLFVFPGHEQEPLDDVNLFVVADFVPFKEEYQENLLELVREAYAHYKTSEKQDATDPLQSMLTNLFKVVDACALWDFNEGAGNFVFTFNQAGQPTIVFLDTERPAFGGGNPLFFFHHGEEEKTSNAGVGRKALDEIFSFPWKEEEVVAAS